VANNFGHIVTVIDGGDNATSDCEGLGKPPGIALNAGPTRILYGQLRKRSGALSLMERTGALLVPAGKHGVLGDRG